MKGRHTLKTGADLRFQLLNYAQPNLNTVSFQFCRQETESEPNAPNGDQGNGLASFMLGWGRSSCNTNYSSGSSQTFNLVPLVASRQYAFYGNDDFRLTPRLTLNLGLRYELPLPFTERHNRLNYINLDLPSPIQSGVNSFMAANPSVDWSTVCPACSDLTGGYVFATSSNRRVFNTDFSN